MKTQLAAATSILLLGTISALAQDWPQWRGPNRDAHADFKAPKTWPKELTHKWKTTVGEGVSTPALVGDRLYVFSRENGNEVIRCLSAADGKEQWQDKYESLGATGPAQGFSGPRSSPAVGSGKVVTVGVRGMVSCQDAATGKNLWRKDEFKDWPNFFPSSSPLILDGVVVAQLGGRNGGALVAYDLASGAEKWKWSGPSPTYASPVLATVGGTKLIIAQTESKVVAVNAADGTLAWEEAPAQPGAPGGPGGGGGGGGRGGGMGGGGYKAATPIVDGQTIYLATRGLKALKLEKEGDKIVAKELWNNPEKSVQFNTPALKNGLLFGLAQNNDVVCINAKDGKTAWSTPWPAAASVRGALDAPIFAPAFAGLVQAPPPATPERPGGQGQQVGPGGQRPGGPGGPGQPGGPGRRGGGGGMGGGGRAGFGSIVDAGSVLLALTPGAQLLVLEPSDKEFKQLASYKVGSDTQAYPVLSGNRIFIKDKDSVTLWTVE